ncbi:uncharacterized protein STEHIDRAFT_149768 [Stereum hirsutum FP-91666 SS1]|uniref:uncharacterized protein n=1 Tax=Stereum hirsutum (strain FP-91666) TaxID=721885 RepID=UPI000444A183|nr:uncharacterized protein STEHIDRAFT_149768 [Stereum hirsutum FP-91666 SS1]EIM82096.1 hypothetical protein STEHIDRAFT_149768 [Stereum hirsutum FP-91666 SS1]
MSDPTRAAQAPEDWDRSESDIIDSASSSARVAFPSDGQAEENGDGAVEGEGSQRGKRTLSELLKLHAAKGSDSNFSAEEATRVADVLGEWINSGSSPYEGEDDFFARAQDDSSVSRQRTPALDSRPRGQSDSGVGKS